MAEQAAGRQERSEVVPGTAGSGRLFDERPMAPTPVECLGITLASDARRAYFPERAAGAAAGLRKRPDCPAGEDADILRLSDQLGTPPAPTRS